MLEDRRSEILKALVEEHIRTGEPVSSRAVAERTRLQVSTATIRNDLAALEAEGFAVQPHTSAGRVPTANAYRYYVDHLGPAKLKFAAQAKIATFFGDVHLELSKLLKATSDLLAEVTDLPAVVVAPGLIGDKVRSVHAVQITADQVLLVAVTEGGRVAQQRGRLRAPVTPSELEEAQALIAECHVGKSLGADVQLPEERVRSLAGPVREAVLTLVDALHLAASAGGEVFVGGTQRLGAVWHDLSAVSKVLEVLEREAEIMALLAAEQETSIHFASELPEMDADVAVVSRSYESLTGGGSVGVIGPMRMNYRRVISAVEEISRELEEQISQTS